NCCNLGAIDSAPTAFNRLASSVARELIEMGVRAVVAAGWAVDDEPASLFAETFYRLLLAEQLPFGDAVFQARKIVWEAFPQSVTWGAYQAYGDPSWRPGLKGEKTKASRPSWTPVAPEELLARLDIRVLELDRGFVATKRIQEIARE